ncbi:MAG: HlyD family secretion protein [Cytophagales bacterium]|nr:HlyD family secretion protein [Cytophagales bacterium]
MPNEAPIRSKSVRDILERIPAWPIMWGNTLLLFLILLVFAISWFVKYPDVLTADAMLTTTIPPYKAYAQHSGAIGEIWVENGEQILKDQRLATFKSTAEERDIFWLKAMTDSITYTREAFTFPLDQLPVLFLGEVEPVFAAFEEAYLEYSSHMDEINREKKARRRTDIDRTSTKVELLKRVVTAYNHLKNSILEWELKYVLKSQINGEVLINDDWKQEQSVAAGDLLFTILPVDSQQFMAFLELPARSAGKVTIGQKVLIELVSFPKSEYGVMVGSIKQISTVPDEKGDYKVQVDLPQGLVTSYGREIEFRYELQGSAEVILEDLRLIDRLFTRLNRF